MPGKTGRAPLKRFRIGQLRPNQQPWVLVLHATARYRDCHAERSEAPAFEDGEEHGASRKDHHNRGVYD